MIKVFFLTVDGKQFDAFISFRSTNMDYSQSEDEKFVIRVLQPMLENNFQYKVCVHYRDFPPGESKSHKIHTYVEVLDFGRSCLYNGNLRQ